jgi:hypothetical protein
MWTSHIHPRSQTKKKKPDTHTQFLCLRNTNAGTCHIYPNPSMEVKSSVLCYMSLPPYYSSRYLFAAFLHNGTQGQSTRGNNGHNCYIHICLPLGKLDGVQYADIYRWQTPKLSCCRFTLLPLNTEPPSTASVDLQGTGLM